MADQEKDIVKSEPADTIRQDEAASSQKELEFLPLEDYELESRRNGSNWGEYSETPYFHETEDEADEDDIPF